MEKVCLFSALAVELGVRRLVLLSGRGEKKAQCAERVVQGASAEWTILRCSWFCQNFSEGYLLDAVRACEMALPTGEMGEPFVDAEDIADVAVAALTENGHAGQLYELTGPRLLTFADAVDEISRATGRKIGFVQVTPEAYAAALKEQGVPPDFAWLLEYMFTTVLDGRNAHLADGVQRALGRQPRDFSEYARRTAGTGVWNFQCPSRTSIRAVRARSRLRSRPGQ